MAGLGRLSPLRHGAVGLAVVGCGVLGFSGLVGSARPERFDAKLVTVATAGDDGARIREVVDEDFGRTDRHGYERIIPNDFGVPTDISATATDAPDGVGVTQVADGTRIRIGDPNETVSGQHRYVLTYTLPDARLSAGELALDIIGTNEELETERFEVVVTGLALTDPLCNVGGQGASGGCELSADGDVYRAVISPLEPGDGITIGGTITGRREIVDVAEPQLPDEPGDHRLPLGAAMTGLAALSAGGVYTLARRRGRNEVFAGGAADAAFGSELPPPTMSGAPPQPPAARAPGAVRLVADADLGQLATTEFEPPRGVPPWLGEVLLEEKITQGSVGAWFSGLAARDVITLTLADDETTVEIGQGSKYWSADNDDLALLNELFEGRSSLSLGTYDKGFASVWRQVKSRQERFVAQSGYWKRMAPNAGGCGGANVGIIVAVIVFWFVIGGGVASSVALGIAGSPVAALLLAVIVPGLVALGAYATLLPSRSVTGSALALRTESFRRFLAASEGRHVEWAWQHGLLREYSAWAVALGTADAWRNALESSTVPPAEIHSGPLLVYSMHSAFSHSYTAPSSSGGGGGFGGGFSGGSVGGGGGGGSSGSW